MISTNTINRAFSGDVTGKKHMAVCPAERNFEEELRNANADFAPVW
jgi:hypothetical protein